MSVHKAISEHSNRQHQRIKQFAQLDSLREMYIEEAVSRCRQGQSFSVEQINEVTKQINELARQGIVPTRKMVTPEMVQEYVERQK
ncbi:YpbS family protein [Bacillus songklensis]|uniref:YpbS family protein n=1 Tax=Bacillus songklensis TaxID=1069116 RepID=A0ABV8B471_9BACI